MDVINHFELFSRADAGRTHFRKIACWKKRKVRQEKTARSYSRYSRGGFSSFWRDKIQGSRAASNADIAVAFKSPGISADGSGKSVCGRDRVWQPARGNTVCA